MTFMGPFPFSLCQILLLFLNERRLYTVTRHEMLCAQGAAGCQWHFLTDHFTIVSREYGQKEDENNLL